MEYLPEEEQIIVERLREVILDAIPNCTEKLKYNVPYYSQYANICFLWPSSIPWGAVENGVSIGFVKGNLISAGLNYLESNGRKTIRSRNFNKLEQIDFDLVRELVYEAVEIDKETRKR